MVYAKDLRINNIILAGDKYRMRVCDIIDGRVCVKPHEMYGMKDKCKHWEQEDLHYAPLNDLVLRQLGFDIVTSQKYVNYTHSGIDFYFSEDELFVRESLSFRYVHQVQNHFEDYYGIILQWHTQQQLMLKNLPNN